MGKWNFEKNIWQSNRSHTLPQQGVYNTAQPTPLNNHQPRVGTKRPAGRHNCQCSMCVGRAFAKQEKIDKIVKKETKRELDNLE